MPASHFADDGNEYLLDIDRPVHQSLRAQVSRECLERLAIGFETIWHRVAGEDGVDLVNVMIEPGQHVSHRAGETHIAQRLLLRRLQALEQTAADPRLAAV